MVETIHVRGEGGSVIAMDLPLPENIAERYAAGALVRVHPDGSPWTADTPAAAAPAQPVEPDAPASPPGSLDRPARSDSKADWVAYAAAVSDKSRDELDDMNKAALIAEFGA